MESSRGATRYYSEGKGKILSEEERAAENVYIKKMERERMEKQKQKAEKERTDNEKETADKLCGIPLMVLNFHFLVSFLFCRRLRGPIKAEIVIFAT
ncbi:hypothetical protein M0R45_036025 [Rubus argutus]|uniref:Uncharacterized protein n=1 Tax=Rubus argutus TaxID=59490 RepID=A0AAW1VVT7_RUBAR